MNDPGNRRLRKLRLFYALWPSDGLRERLVASARAAVAIVEGRPVAPGNLHVTLAFLGMVSGTRLAPVIEIGGRGPWPTVELTFGQIEYWAKPKVLVAMPAAVPDSGRRIVERLWNGLDPIGFTRELRPWQPHLTIARQVRRPPLEVLGLAPAVEAGDSDWRLALVESVTHAEGPRYQPLAEWALASGGDSPL